MRLIVLLRHFYSADSSNYQIDWKETPQNKFQQIICLHCNLKPESSSFLIKMIWNALRLICLGLQFEKKSVWVLNFVLSSAYVLVFLNTWINTDILSLWANISLFPSPQSKHNSLSLSHETVCVELSSVNSAHFFYYNSKFSISVLLYVVSFWVTKLQLFYSIEDSW